MLAEQRRSRKSDQTHTVMRSVFEGGEGYISGGRFERSRVREVRQGF